jgi:ABC-type transport system involved in multi-copper enzyme maturation permease subunit
MSVLQIGLRIGTLAHNTIREAIRNKLLYTLLFFAIALIGTGVLVSMLSYVESERILQDVGLAAIRLMSVGIAVFVGVGLIHGEVKSRTIYTILSKPVSRVEFLLGKYTGLVATTWLMLVVMGVAFAGVSLACGAPLDMGHLTAFFLIGMELVVMVAVATLFSAFTTPMLASLFTVGVYLLGHLSRDLRLLGEQAQGELLRPIANFLFELLPDLESFNVTIQAVHQLPIPAAEVGWAVVYGSCYAAGLLICASYLFSRRDFR